MKALLIIGLLLFVGGLVYGASKPQTTNQILPSTGGASVQSTTGTQNIVTYSIVIGFLLMIASGVMYLRR